MILKGKCEGDLGGVGGKLGQIFYVCVCMCGIFKKNRFLKVNSGSMLIHVQVGLVLQSEALAQVGDRVFKSIFYTCSKS